MIAKLAASERAALPDVLPLWRMAEGRDALIRRFIFKDFAATFAFMSRVARLAEEQDHHPEWSNLYNKVEIILTTHEAGGLSSRDIRLARAIDSLS
jgi:4a-hydroxytetrahydrobiopterin dehydratase